MINGIKRHLDLKPLFCPEEKKPCVEKLRRPIKDEAGAIHLALNKSEAVNKETQRESLLLARHFDPRIRSLAMQKLAKFSDDDEWMLDLANYNQITSLLQNSERNVRLLALKIISKCVHCFPDVRLKNAKGFFVRAYDDAFSHVCYALNDMDNAVRAQAAALLGSFPLVSDAFLHQTLDKKLIAQMKVSATGELITSSDIWSTGKKLTDDVPNEQENESEALIPSGACGAFVTALEDEFMVVRQAAVYSIGQLAANKPSFAIICIDHLADMFNDEIQQVRLDAIRALTPLVSHGTLQREQLNTILTALDDATPENRMSLHLLLAKANLADSSCVLHCLQTLLRSLRRFPLDKYSIYKCISSIGLRHSSLIQSLVVDLLGIHPIFDMPEQNIEDDYYLAKLILVLNAASMHESICSLIPEYVEKHYRYLRRSSPHLIPVIERFEIIKDLNYSQENLNAILIGADNLDALINSAYKKVMTNVKNVKIQDPEIFDAKQTEKLAKVLNPSNESQNTDVIRFVAGIPTSISVRYVLTNLTAEEVKQFRIRVEYPDQSISFFRPTQKDFLHLNEQSIRLQTNVIISAKRWAYPAAIILKCGLFNILPAKLNIDKKNKKEEGNARSLKPGFVVLPDADNSKRENKISVNVHPVQKL